MESKRDSEEGKEEKEETYNFLLEGTSYNIKSGKLQLVKQELEEYRNTSLKYSTSLEATKKDIVDTERRLNATEAHLKTEKAHLAKMSSYLESHTAVGTGDRGSVDWRGNRFINPAPRPVPIHSKVHALEELEELAKRDQQRRRTLQISPIETNVDEDKKSDDENVDSNILSFSIKRPLSPNLVAFGVSKSPPRSPIPIEETKDTLQVISIRKAKSPSARDVSPGRAGAYILRTPKRDSSQMWTEARAEEKLQRSGSMSPSSRPLIINIKSPKAAAAGERSPGKYILKTPKHNIGAT